MLVSTFPINNFIGTFTSIAVSIPDNAVSGSIELDGASMTNPLLRISIALDFSPDNGVTWSSTSPGPDMNPFPVIATYEGGAVDKNGNLATSYGPAVTFPPGTNRKIRGTFIVDGVLLTTTATISVS